MATSLEGDVVGEIHLGEFVRANESEIRWKVESLVLHRVTQAIGRENLEKVRLFFWGSTLDDMTLQVEGPQDLKAKIEEAFRKD